MPRSRKLLALSASAVVALAGVTACGSGGSGGGGSASGGDYVIGFSDGLTGPTSGYTQPELTYAKAVFDAVNAGGGVNGHQIKLVSYDQGAPGSGQASANVLKLASQDKVSAIIGMLISNDCASVVATAERFKVPILCQRAPIDLLSPPNKYIFVSQSVEVKEVDAAADAIKTITGKTSPRVATLNVDNIGAGEWRKRWAADAASKSITLTTQQVQPATATSISSQVAAIVASKPDVVVAELFGQFFQPLLDGLKNAGLNIPVIATTGTALYTTLSTATPGSLIQTNAAPPLEPGAAGATADQKALVAGFAKEGKTSAADLNGGEGMMFALAPYAVAAALKTCGFPCNGEDMATALEKVDLNVPGVIPSGVLTYSADNHAGVSKYQFDAWDAATKLPKTLATGNAGSLTGG